MTFSLIYVRAFTKLLYELHDVSTRNSSELFQAKGTLAINSLALWMNKTSQTEDETIFAIHRAVNKRRTLNIVR